VRDCLIAPAAVAAHRLQNDQGTTGGAYIYACEFGGPAALFYDGEGLIVSSQFTAPASFSNMLAALRNSVWRAGAVFEAGALANVSRSNCFDGSQLTVHEALIQFTGTPGDVQFVDQPAGVFAIEVHPGGCIDADPGAVVWGANNGVMLSAIHMRSGTQYAYADAAAKPIIPGAAPNDVNLGGVLLTYAAIPSVTAANNAQMVVRS